MMDRSAAPSTSPQTRGPVATGLDRDRASPHQSGVTRTVLDSRHGVWVPAFAGTTRSESDDHDDNPLPFTHVETWVFDLDNTLYPHDLNLWQQIDERIRAFVADFLKVTKDEALPRPEGLLQALRHHDARADDRARHEARRLPRLRAPDRSFAAGAEPGARRRDRRAARPQAHPHQRHAQACRSRDASGSTSTSISRTCSTSSPPTSSRSRRRRPIDRFLSSTASIRRRPRCSRTWRAISTCRTRSA